MTERVGLPRRYTFKLYPSAVQAAALQEQARMCAELWNALLQRQEDTWRRTRGQRGVLHAEGRSFHTYFDLTREITALRAACPEWRALSSLTATRVADALVKAFEAFFRRVATGAGTRAGYPRFKLTQGASTIPHRFASGCALSLRGREDSDVDTTARSRNWRVALKGILGLIRARGEFPADPARLTLADVIFRDGAWHLSVCANMPPRRSVDVPVGRGPLSITFDLIDQFARVECADGATPAPRGSARAPTQSPDEDERGQNSQEASRDERDNMGSPRTTIRRDNRIDIIKSNRDRRYRGPWSPGGRRQRPSWRWLRETRRAAVLSAGAARIRREQLHVWTTSLVRRATAITVMGPDNIRNATRSPRGDAQSWGACVSTVSTLNRHVLWQAPGLAIRMLTYKSAEAGVSYEFITDAAPPVAIGAAIVTAGKTARRARRVIKGTAA